MTFETFVVRFTIAATLAASSWLFFYDIACNRSSFTHSGTQPYVRVIR